MVKKLPFVDDIEYASIAVLPQAASIKVFLVPVEWEKKTTTGAKVNPLRATFEYHFFHQFFRRRVVTVPRKEYFMGNGRKTCFGVMIFEVPVVVAAADIRAWAACRTSMVEK